MTLEEAKKILEKEFAVISLHKSTEPFEFDESGWIEHEKPSVLEAFRVLSKGGYYISISGHDYNMREKRLKKEYEENTKAPGSSENRIKEDSGVNPALAESASQFNDALLDEQGKKIKRLGKEITRLNKIIHKKNEELRLTKIREKNLAELGLKYVGENEKLKKKLADKIVDEIDARALKSAESALAYKDEVIETLDKELAEVKHELSSLKRPFRPDSTEAVVLFTDAYAKAVRKHLPCTEWKNDGKEVSVTYILENGKKSKIALDFTGDEIIFSRTDPDKPRKDSLYSYKDKQLAEKDEVIADLGNELAATKKELEEKTKLVEVVRKGSKEYCEYGIAAEKMIRKMANVIVYEGKVSSKEFEEYRRWANGYRFNPQLYDFIEEEEKKLEHAKKIRVSSDNAEEGADLYGVIVLCDKDYIDALKKAKDADIWQE